MAQYQAGYFIEGIKKMFFRDKDFEKTSGLMHELSFFELESENDLNHSINDSIVSVFNNLLVRGLPALPSTFIEDFISTTFSRTRKKTDDDNNLQYNFINDELKKTILRALHIVEPRITKKNFEKNKKKTKLEKEIVANQFLYDFLIVNFGEQILQLIEQNRNIEDISKYNKNLIHDFNYLKSNDEYKFLSDSTDFTIEIPFVEKELKGLAFLIDDGHAVDNTDYKVEEKKSAFLKRLNWNYGVKIKKTDLQDSGATIDQLSFFTSNSYFDNLRNNFKSPLYKTEEGLDALQIVLSPLGVARIQKTLVEFILSGNLDLNAQEWNIAVIERDIPCAFVAIEDLKQHFKKLFILEGKDRKLPKINLSIYFTEEFEQAELNVLYQGKKSLISEFEVTEEYDLLIDISVLRRKDCDFEILKHSAKKYAKIRSVKSINSARAFITTDLIPYKPILNQNSNKTEDEEDEEIETNDAIRYFLKNIFRKNNFLDFQINILNEALQLKNTLVAAPYQCGKTICYELAAMLQPGISLIINPVMSLMKEQFDELRDLNIDGIYYLNSSQTKFSEKRKAKEKIKNGEVLITFISADKLQNEEFRTDLNLMNLNEKYFAYTIIDEAHCMSEWSHDYREAFSAIPSNARTYCNTKNTPDIPIIAVTSYASYDVIADLSAKLKIDNSPIIINQEVTNLNFEFKKISIDNSDEIKEIDKLKNATNIKKQLELNQLLEKSILEKLSTLVICPDRKGLLSVDSINDDGLFSKLQNTFKNKNITKFEGVIDDGIYSVGSTKSNNSYQNYKQFKNNNFDVLIANKSIGIGLNKKDLRNIIYLNIPLSTESFIQLNDRAGRDKNAAQVLVLYNNDKIKISDKEFKSDNIGEINVLNIEKETSVDFERQSDFFKKIYGNRYKDSLLFKELLDKISFSKVLPVNKLKLNLEQEFNENFKLTTQPGSKPYQLHLEKSNKNIGFVDFKNNTIIVKASVFEQDIAEQILLYANDFVQKAKPENSEIFQWLENEYIQNDIEGLEIIINNLNINDEAEFVVGFSNNKMDLLSDIIRKFIDEKFDADLIQIYNESSDFDNFKSNILSKLNINLTKLTTNTLFEVNDLYDNFRGYYDTLRVVNKLFLINVIADYSIDYYKEHFKIKLIKKNEDEHKLAIYKYLLLYVSKDKALKSFEELSVFAGETILKKCLNYFNNFWFDNIVNKRLNSLLFLSDIFNIEKDETFNQKLQNFHLNFLNSKYFNEITSWSLINKTNKFTKNDFSIIEYYIAQIGFLKDSWEHLKKSTEMLLKENENNSILLILNGYTETLLNPDKEEILDVALSKITDGIGAMSVFHGIKLQELNEKANWIIEKIYEQNLDIKKKIDGLLELKLYTSWLKKFNKKLLAV